MFRSLFCLDHFASISHFFLFPSSSSSSSLCLMWSNCPSLPVQTPVVLSWSASAEGSVCQNQTWTGHEAAWQAQLWHQGTPRAANVTPLLRRAPIPLLVVCLPLLLLITQSWNMLCYMLNWLKNLNWLPAPSFPAFLWTVTLLWDSLSTPLSLSLFPCSV